MAKSIYDLGMAVREIREAANSIEVKGRQNAAYIVYINHQCDVLIGNFNEMAENVSAENSGSAVETDGEMNGQNTGTTE